MKIRKSFPLLLLAFVVLCSPVFAQGLGDLPSASKPPEKSVTKSSKGKTSPPVSGTKTTTKTKPPRNAGNTSAPPPPPTSYARNPAKYDPISLNQQIADKLDAQTSGRITATSYYNEYKFIGSSADIFTVQLETADPNLAVQIYNSEQIGQPILRDPLTKEFKLSTPGGTLPADGEYRVRVVGTLNNSQSTPYSLKLKRAGMTEAGYLSRLDTIIKSFNQSGSKNIDETISQLQELIEAEPARPSAYETLGVAYLYFRNDLVKAVDIMEKTIRMGGTAKFKVSHDARWKKPRRSKSGEGLEWEEKRESWLYIRQGQVALTDAADNKLSYFSLGAQQVREITRVASTPGISLKPQVNRAPTYLFAPITLNTSEAEIIVNLIKNYVLAKK